MISKKISMLLLISFALCEASDSITYSQNAVDDVEIKTALGKTILNQQEMMVKQKYLNEKVDMLEKELQALKNKDVTIVKSFNEDITTTIAVTTFPYTNIRKQPSIDSDVKRVVKANTVLPIETCVKNGTQQIWCKLLNEDAYMRDFTLSFANENLSKKQVAQSTQLLK